jgi:hypothetical protein
MFHKIVTVTGQLSSMRYAYMYELIYERIFEKRLNRLKPTYWMERGKFLEPIGRCEFSKLTGQEVLNIGLLLADDPRIAASPDGIVDWDHSVEIKCPQPWKHMQYSVMGPGSDYQMQIQGQIYVGQFSKVSFLSYCPGMPCIVHPVYPIDKIQKALTEAMPRFADELDENERLARKLGDYKFEEMGIGEEFLAENTVDG